MSPPRVPQTPKHQPKPGRSLVRTRCICGWFFYNENLRMKNDVELAAELDFEFDEHLKDMARR